MFFDVNSWYNDTILNLGGYLMSNTILRNENVSVTLKSLGGELTSIKDASGTEYLWQGNPDFWSGQAPVLFPIVGCLRNGTATIGDSKTCSFGRHGLARKLEFTLVSMIARSGNCSQNCAYCAQSCRSHADIEKYKWVDDEKLYGDNTFVHDHKLSRHCIGLSGMKFSDEEIEELASKIRKMKEEGTHLCCSIGFLTKKQALMLKEAGLDRINHNLNTSRSNYPNICTTHTYEQRVNNIHMLQDLGFEICSGGIIGMGESKEDVVDMLFDLKEINPEALPINFLIPIKGTPLQDRDTSNLTPEYGLRVLCLARLLVPTSDIRCAAGREIYFKGREKELLTVVNSIFASGYLTADGQGIEDTIKTITDAGFTCEVESD